MNPFTLNKFIQQMQILSREEVLEQEIKFLNLPGQALSNFYAHDAELNLFTQPSATVKNKLSKHQKLKNIKSSGQQPNSVFNILTYHLLTTIVEEGNQSESLQKLKSTLYSDKLNLKEIKKNPHQNLSNGVMKKILVQLFQVISYWNTNFETMLCRYNIVLQIFALYFRTILKSICIQGAENYIQEVDNFQAACKILDYFQFLYKQSGTLIVFENKKLSLYFDQHTKQCFMGQRCPDFDNKSSDMSGQEKQLQEKPTPFFQYTTNFSETMANAHKLIEQNSMHNNDANKPSIEQNDQEYLGSSNKKINLPFQILVNLESKGKKIEKSDQGNVQHFQKQYQNTNISHKSSKPFSIEMFKSNYSYKTSNNPETGMKISQIHKYDNEQETTEKKQTLSQRAGKRQKSLTDEQLEGNSKFSDCCHRNPNNKIESCVMDLKIEPTFEKRYKTTTQDNEIKFQKKKPLKSYQNNNKNLIKPKSIFPLFLAKRSKQNEQIQHSSRNSKSPISQMALPFKQQVIQIKPKVTFTYLNKTQRNSSYINTQPSRISYEPFNQFYEKIIMKPQYHHPITQRSQITERKTIYLNGSSSWNHNFL